MKLPEDVKVPKDKLLQYLLLPREENDKSEFLKLAGYRLSNWKELKEDLFELATRNEVTETESSPYGTKYEVRGKLTGPNGRELHVVSIWIELEKSGEIRFVTLFPDREVER
ncbi:MAG: DUF6883 domain-containing protein [Candidatus Bipolaricaulia bacterium]